MTVTSVLHRSAVGRSAIPYCNSDVVIKVGGRQVGSVQKLYDRHVTNLQVGGRQVDNSVHRTCRPVYRRTIYCRPVYLILSICRPPSCRPAYRQPAFLFLGICLLPTYLPPTCQPIFSSLCSICLPPTCLPSTCLPIPLYLPTD